MRFLWGLGVGLGLGLLFAPAPGEETRQKLSDKAQAWMRVPQEKMEQAADAAKEKAGDLGSRIGRQAAQAAVESVREEVLGDKTA